MRIRRVNLPRGTWSGCPPAARGPSAGWAASDLLGSGVSPAGGATGRTSTGVGIMDVFDRAGFEPPWLRQCPLQRAERPRPWWQASAGCTSFWLSIKRSPASFGLASGGRDIDRLGFDMFGVDRLGIHGPAVQRLAVERVGFDRLVFGGVCFH